MKTRNLRMTRSRSRISIGLLIVAGSVLAAHFAIDFQQGSRSVLVASEDLFEGSLVSKESIDVIELAENPALALYLGSEGLSATSELVLSRSVVAGEFFRREDFVEPSLRNDSVVSIPLHVGKPQWLEPGRIVQLWVAPPTEENLFSAPFVLSPEALISRVSYEEGFAADGVSSRVDVQVPNRHIPSLVHALANRYFIHLSPVSPTL